MFLFTLRIVADRSGGGGRKVCGGSVGAACAAGAAGVCAGIALAGNPGIPL